MAHTAEIQGGSHTVAAVKVDKTENVGGTALSAAVETAAGDVGDLALLDIGRGEGSDEAGAQGDDGGGELHVDGCLLVWDF